jgi:hypothetical protein
MESDRVGKIPFTVSKRELSSMIFPDDRLAGWGVFFSGVTFSSLAIFLVGRGWRGNDPVIVALVIIAATIFINPDCWWARFTPQVAFVPIFFLLPGLKSESDVLRRCALVVCALLVVNNLLFLAGSVRACFVNSQALNRSFIALSQAKGEGEYWAYRSDKMYFHYEQFSGLKGIVICGELDPPRDPLPQSGFPLGTNRPFALFQPAKGHISPGQDQYGGPEVILFKGQCSSKPPL